MTQVLGRALVQRGHTVRVVGLYPQNYPAPNYEEDQGVRVWRLRANAHRFGRIADRYRLFRTVATWSRRHEIDLVEVPDWEGWSAGWPRLSIPVVTRMHGSGTYFAAETGRRIRRPSFWLERAALRRADSWCAVSRYTAERTRHLFGAPSGRGAILYNPVEEVCDRGVARNSHVVVFAGSLTAKKAIVSLVKAWPEVLKTCNGAKLHVFGKDGRAANGQSMKAYLLAQLDPKEASSVQFHGHVSREELFQTYQLARVAVFPSYAEAFALAPLEAMACGCPVIYTRRCSGPELIRDGRDGLLVDPDRLDEIARAIVRLLTDDETARLLGKAGKARARERFSLDLLVPQNEAFYDICLHRGDGSACGGSRGNGLVWM